MGMDVKVECFFPNIQPPSKAVGDVPLYLSMGIRDQMPLIWEPLCHRWEPAPVLKNQARPLALSEFETFDGLRRPSSTNTGHLSFAHTLVSRNGVGEIDEETALYPRVRDGQAQFRYPLIR